MAINRGSATQVFKPVTLEGNVVRLEPIRYEHVPLFWDVVKGTSEEIFRWFPWSMRTGMTLDNT